MQQLRNISTNYPTMDASENLSNMFIHPIRALSKEMKARRFQEQLPGHIFAKMFALVVNLVAMGTAFWYDEFGTSWDKVLSHGIFGTIPVHIMTIFLISIATKFSREVSMIHDYLCTATCGISSMILYFVLESEAPTSLFLFIAAVMLGFDLMIHFATEKI